MKINRIQKLFILFFLSSTMSLCALEPLMSTLAKLNQELKKLEQYTRAMKKPPAEPEKPVTAQLPEEKLYEERIKISHDLQKASLKKEANEIELIKDRLLKNIKDFQIQIITPWPPGPKKTEFMDRMVLPIDAMVHITGGEIAQAKEGAYKKALVELLPILRSELPREKPAEPEKPKEEIKAPTFAYPTFSEWYSACKQLPFRRHMQEDQYYQHKPEKLTFEEVIKTTKEFIRVTQDTIARDKKLWIEEKMPKDDFFDIKNDLFLPFAQKLTLNEGDQVAFHGDLHGDIHSVVEYINGLKNKNLIDDNFKIINPKFYIVFLGDYVDRGNYGIEVIYTLLRLKIANPHNVFMVRGNHEDASINVKYGFGVELLTKFKVGDANQFNPLFKIYEILPVVLYVGTNNQFIQCCHGGMELGYLPTTLLDFPQRIAYEPIQELKRVTNLEKIPKFFKEKPKAILQDLPETYEFRDFKPTKTHDIGFLWNDFILNKEGILYPAREGEVWATGMQFTAMILRISSTKNNAVVGVFRAHQHGDADMMEDILEGNSKGISKIWRLNPSDIRNLWKNIVVTFNVTPDTAYGKRNKFNFDTYAILTLGKKSFPDGWKLERRNVDIVPEKQ